MKEIRPIDANYVRKKVVKHLDHLRRKPFTGEVEIAMRTLAEVERYIDDARTLDIRELVREPDGICHRLERPSRRGGVTDLRCGPDDPDRA